MSRSSSTTRARAAYRWVDERTGLTELVHKGLYEAVPEQGGWAYTLGSATLVLILLQLFTGIFLLLDYVPSVTQAWSSLNYLRTDDPFGAWVRGLHLWGAYTLILVIGLHALRTFLSASYKRPRELNWMSGVILFFLVLGLAATGAMLPWDNAAYWTATVITNILHYVPFIGDGLRQLWRGGTFVGPITLTRTFAIHIWVLPFLLFTFIGGHIYLLRRHGEFGAWVNYDTSTDNPSREVAERIRSAEPPYPTKRIERRYAAPNKTVDFFPNQLFKDTLVSAVLILFIFVMGLAGGAPLDTIANPATLTYVPTPEWFYLPLDQFLVLTPQNPLIAIGVLVIVGGGAAAMFLLPVLDRSPERRPTRRPEILVPAIFVIFAVIFLATLGVNRLYSL
ncbi:MAG TPA: cytochrome bc complex cytochrome b subunit [Candidatus Dormibacteraeota bacterium]